MKDTWKRVCAVAASAAMAIAGLAVGATSANAVAPTNQTITIQSGGKNSGVVAGHTFKYVQIAVYPNENTKELYTVNDTTVKAAVKGAVEAALSATSSSVTVPDGMDPLVWAQNHTPSLDNSSVFPWNTDSTSRKFADTLADALENEGVWSQPVTAEAEAEELEISGLRGGLYLIIDTTSPADSKATNTLPMLVGTPNTGFGVDGTVMVKNQQTDTPPTKTVTGDTSDSVTIGNTLTYTITGKIPSTTDQDDGYTYVFSDYASTGLSINTSSIKVHYKDNGNVEQTLDAAKYTVNPANSIVTGKGAETTAEATFTVTLSKTVLDTLQVYAGNDLYVTYDATVTAAAEINPATNTATVTQGGKTSESSAPVKTHSTPVIFTKIKASDETGLSGATFSIQPVAGTGTGTLPADYVASVTSADDGVVKFAGLADGTYEITETRTPEGYMNTGLSFKIKVNHDNTTKPVTFISESSSWGVALGLVNQSGSGKITVKNSASISQLPLTGAAGTVLFTVVGLLVAGAAVTLYTKSRKLRNDMRI